MVNVYFFDIRDGGTDNFGKLYDGKYLLWNKKSNNMSIDDYCIVYYQKENLLLSTNIVADNIVPKFDNNSEDITNNYFVEFNGKKHYFEGSENYTEFIAFEVLNEYSTEQDFTINIQGGITLLTKKTDTKFKEQKLPLLLDIIKEKEIKEIITEYAPVN